MLWPLYLHLYCQQPGGRQPACPPALYSIVWSSIACIVQCSNIFVRVHWHITLVLWLQFSLPSVHLTMRS
jgi:hypothetical protein